MSDSVVDSSKSFSEVIALTKTVIADFAAREEKEWGSEAIFIELTKQLGDLAKRIMMFENYYISARKTDPNYATSKADIADELSDLFTNIIRLADKYEIDFAAEHLRILAKTSSTSREVSQDNDATLSEDEDKRMIRDFSV